MGALTYRVNYGTVVATCNLAILVLKLRLVFVHAVMTSMACGMDERAMLGASVFHIMALRQWSRILFTSNLQARELGLFRKASSAFIVGLIRGARA
jgi:hypothetical protein